MKHAQKFLLALVMIVLSACSSAPVDKEDPLARIELSSFWVQDTLAKPNTAFRKINRMSPLIYKDQLITGNSIDGLNAYRIEDHSLIWNLPIQNGVEAPGLIINDRLFVGANNGKLYSVNLTNGQIIWNFDTKSEIVAEPILIEGVLYFLSGSQSVFAVDAVSGKQLWTYNRQDTSSLMTVRGGSKPSYAAGFLFVGFSDGSVVSLNAKPGTPQ